MLVFALLLASCKNGKDNILESNKGMLNINKYISSLSSEKIAPLKEQTDLLLHPLKDAIALCGDDYEFLCEGSYAELHFNKAKCSFEVYVGERFEDYDNNIDFDDCGTMEHLVFSKIEKVVLNDKGKILTDGISIGMSVREISEILNVTGINYRNSSSMVTTEYDENGKQVNVYYLTGQISNVDYAVVFAGDILSRVEFTKSSRYLADEKNTSDNGKQFIKQAFSFVSKKGLAGFDLNDLTYKGNFYSSYYGSWFDSWQFAQGNYKDYEICVERNSPNRIYIASSSLGMPFVFWCDGEYVDPILSFLGRWREHGDKEYIDIKSISKEGTVVFDMYVHKDINAGDMVLLKNLSTTINELPKTLDDYLLGEKIDEALDGDAQLYDGNVQSGYYSYAGDKHYLIDSLLLNFNGSVQYLPRGIGGRVGAGPLTIHIPNENYKYEQPSTWGYMENFGRDDPNEANTIKANKAAGEAIINSYLNELYETTGLNHSDIEYHYLYDYLFPVNNKTYHVWESNDKESPHYLYVDTTDKLIIKECELNVISKHSKDLIYKSNTIVDSKSYANQKYITLDGKIVVDLTNRVITKTDAFVNNISLPEIFLDNVGKNERFMFFSSIGNKYNLNGYVLFDHTTWGATLNITDSNIPDFEIGVYYLNSESFFVDPSIGVVGVPDNSENDKYLEDKLEESNKETKIIIREFSGKIIGYIYVNEQGKKTVKDYYGRILGYYYPDRDVTTDYYGKTIYRGDAASALLFSEQS